MTRYRRLETGRRGLVVLAFAALGLTLVGPAVAGHLADGVKSYTGCLTTQGGTLALIREGNAPAKACPSGSTEAHFSGGDITGVTAGTGLTGGGTNGNVTISLDPKYGLRQDCADGQILEWTDGAGEWACAQDDDTTYTAGTGLTLNGTEFSVDSDFALPACNLGESATVVIDAQSAFGTWGCADKADADQDCSSGQYATGVDANGQLSCGTPSTGGAGPAVWTLHRQTVDVPQLDARATIASLTPPPGTYFAMVTGLGQDDFHGNARIDIVCTFDGSHDTSVISDNSESIAATVVTTITEQNQTIELDCKSLEGSDHIEDLTITAIKLGSVVAQ
jgi:hypothetical protein